MGIFVPSWMHDPSRTAYRYLQHYIQHPALWKVSEGRNAALLGRKIAGGESGRHGEPYLCGDGYARIGEGSGSTNMLTGSGVDEAWATGTQLGEAVIELLRAGKPFTQENLAATYENRRRASWVERGAQEAENARNGFQDGIVKGMIGMALAGLTHGKLSLSAHIPPPHKQIRSLRLRNPPKASSSRTQRSWPLPMAAPSTMRCSRRAAGRRFLSMAACWSRSRTRC